MTEKARTAILISGRGSNMRALVEVARAPDFPARIVGVFSNKPEAEGLEFARKEGIPTEAFSHRDYDSREAFDADLEKVLEGWEAELVCHAGFMRILSEGFVRRWEGRMLNIHPSLLPKYPGLRTHAAALEAGDHEHGCSVHFVVPELDAGPVIAQAHVPVIPGDDPEALAARVLTQEHMIYPMALRDVARGRVRLVQNEARWRHRDVLE